MNTTKRTHQPNAAETKNIGHVWLVGAGPGDPDLLTIKAVRAIEQADLILFDNLVSEGIRALFPPAVPAFYVGKCKDNHSIAQKDINALMVKHARAGKQVCRIKGGDPFVFGRGGEEMLSLIKAGVRAEVIPGITSASGCSAYAGIPLTHRGVTQGCTFITAHAEKVLKIDWQSLVALDHTLVFYMGLTRVVAISSSLIKAGMVVSTPAAIVENGCRPNQRTLIGTVETLPDLVEREAVKAPALILVGNVVDLADQLRPGGELNDSVDCWERLSA